ncbi:ABC transporter substrate-binding protein [Bordetella trematum]|uniref:ABC transporter substrate-binding protein n=1 Tax=Bordetella trematum TaxID=123899 RepID=UPI003989D452
MILRLLRSAVLAGCALPACAAPIIDMLGASVPLTQPPQRVVTLPMPAAALFLSIEPDATRLAGMHPNAQALMQDGLLMRHFPSLRQVRSDVTRSGFAPNIESLLLLQPDLIWQWGHMGDELIAPLRQAGLPVAALRYGDDKQTRQWIALMGQAQDQQTRAKAQLQWRAAVRERVAAEVASIPPGSRPGVLYLSRQQPQYRSAGAGSSTDEDIRLAGGRNVAARIGSAQAIGVEQILTWAPDVILLGNFDDGLTPEAIYADPLLADLPAVRQRRVYKVPAGGYPWDPPSQESPLYWEWLAMQLHPALPGWPLREHIRQAYQQLYGLTVDAAQIDRVLHLPLNQEAAGYERLR